MAVLDADFCTDLTPAEGGDTQWFSSNRGVPLQRDPPTQRPGISGTGAEHCCGWLSGRLDLDRESCYAIVGHHIAADRNGIASLRVISRRLCPFQAGSSISRVAAF